LRGGPVYGAGVLIDDTGHVLTCDHVVDGVEDLKAYFHARPAPSDVKILERDAELDLALLLVEDPPLVATPLHTGSVVDLSMGDVVYAMGAPRKMQFSFSRGIVSYVGRAFDGTLYVQSDLAANSGSSGGPVFNERGELVGLSSFILRDSHGLSFAVPIDYAYRRFAQLRGDHERSRFGIWLAARAPSKRDGK
jgi:serine protease Do